ncbi:MAG: hypothetical protein R2787_12485 [Saprospiraceae bacterium]
MHGGIEGSPVTGTVPPAEAHDALVDFIPEIHRLMVEAVLAKVEGRFHSIPTDQLLPFEVNTSAIALN